MVVIAIVMVGCLAAALTCGGLMLLLLPEVDQARATARRINSVGHLKQIGIALHNYHETYGSLPPAYISDEDGQPMHSWRVLILPFLERSDLYNQYDFSEPWDGPHNIGLIHKRPLTYENPQIIDEDSTTTTYQAIAGPGTCFDPMVQKMTLHGITDGTANTAMVVENFGEPVVWTQPDDTSPESFLAGESAIGARDCETLVMKADTSILTMQQSDLPKLKAWTTRAGDD
ncbi:DUF1559 family PulG-like putative transporter [Blastopirellula marina]|uniref:DUF1559 domain-containing protein n=1 Tax=Blastopirellula marina DSM 3645 TaxID=314230 RepID=A4A105_9BACT|nr:DUF1559 domain-containing protein [Blastopirellula marina]EAQ77572.1 hypothetical protein DSM3645_08231 [Blastopirellula marina DSM 3645]